MFSLRARQRASTSHGKAGATVYVLGTASLTAELAGYGLAIAKANGVADVVVAGFDTELTYNKILNACACIEDGADYIATNPDYVCPVQNNRRIPDCGAICFMIEQATGERPLVIGKPGPEMVYQACRNFNAPLDRAVMIGDRLTTDIAAGRNAGVFTVCVLTGDADRNAVELSQVKPNLVVGSIGKLNQIFTDAA